MGSHVRKLGVTAFDTSPPFTRDWKGPSLGIDQNCPPLTRRDVGHRWEDEGMTHWSVDLNAGASYLTLTDKPIVRTVQAGPVNVDLDAQGEAVGVEFLHPAPVVTA